MPGPPVRLKFNEAKAAEAAARLIHLAGGSMNYMKLIKLLYLADRKALEEWARPISSDRYVAMKNGPVLSRVLNLIRSRVVDVPGPWRHLISPPDDYTVSLVTDEPPPGGELSKAEERLIDNVFAEHGSRISKAEEPIDSISSISSTNVLNGATQRAAQPQLPMGMY